MRRPMASLVVALVATALLATSAWAQSSTSIGNNTLQINNPLGLVFDIRSLVPTSEIVIGESGGADVDLLIKDPNFSVNEAALWFNASVANLMLGSGTGSENGDDGDLIVNDNKGVQTIRLSGDSGGQATQSKVGNGFVKAWVRVLGTDGSVLSSYNVTAVERTVLGVYHVTFSDPDFNERPMTAMLDGHASTPSSGGISVGLDDGFHTGQKQVFTYDKNGDAADRSFNLVVY